MKEANQKGITVKKNEDFSEWYTQMIQKAELADYSPVSGCIVFRPTAYAVWEKIQMIVDRELKKRGIKNSYFPLLIPERLLTQEAEHFKGFTPEVAWVTCAGDAQLDEKLAIRPTSETIMYYFYSKWIRSWRDLPLKLNQWQSVVRWEFKHPVPFLRTREFLWNEGHTAYAAKEEAEEEVKDILEMYQKVLEKEMALPSLPGKKTPAETFAGAEYTLSLELYLPNGKAIQGPDAHHDGQKFAKAYDIKFLNKEGAEEYVWQNTFAITTRMLGVMFAIHGDDKGLILPPRVAPVKAVVVPILFKGKEKKVISAARKIFNKLKKYDCLLDDREHYTAGWKFNEWELKGVPLRIEIGPKDVEKNQAVVARRDTGEKSAVKISELAEYVGDVLDDIQNQMYAKAEKMLKKNVVSAKDWNDFLKKINAKKIVVAPWCGNEECLENLKAETKGAKTLNMPFDQKLKKGAKCIRCDSEARYVVRFGKSY